MLNVNASRITESLPMLLSSTVASIPEGAFCSVVLEGGSAKVAPCTGATGEILAGFARSQFLNPTTSPRTEDVVVSSSSPYVATLARTPLLPTTKVGAAFVAAGTGIAGTALTYNASPAATGDFAISGTTMTFHSSDAGKTIRVTYNYNLTVIEAQALYGQGVNDGGQSVTQGLDIVTDAQVLYTDMYDPSDAWHLGGPIYTQAGGKITLKTGGTLLPRCYVVQAPNGTGLNSFLGVYVSI